MPFCRDLLKIIESGTARFAAHSLSRMGGIVSGPLPLDVSSCCREDRISSVENVIDPIDREGSDISEGWLGGLSAE